MRRLGDPTTPSRGGEPDSSLVSVLSLEALADDAVMLLRLAGLDAELDRLCRSVETLVALLRRQREDLAALGELVDKDRREESTPEDRAGKSARLRRFLRNERTHQQLAEALKADEAEVLAMSLELRRKTSGLVAERNATLVRMSAPVRNRYEEALRSGQRPALVPATSGRCPGCGQTLSDESQRLIVERLSFVPCSGCERLLYDRGSVVPDHRPSMLGPAAARTKL